MTNGTPSKVRLTIPGEPEYAGLVRLVSAGIAHRLDLEPELADDLKLVATEMAAHVMSLGAEHVEMVWELGERSLIMVVEAIGDAPPAVPTPAEISAWEEIGLLLVHSLMDEVSETKSPRALRAVKYLFPDDE